VWIGVGSYSLYLWQQPFLNRENPSLLTAFPQNLVLAALAAAAMYFLVERPSLRLRQQWEDAFFGVRSTQQIVEPVP
jgi:peptidoglycan/LPS O-acetylase OafA/YrhL